MDVVTAGNTRPAVLLVDDDVELCELLSEALEKNDFGVELAHDGNRGLARAVSGEHDIVLLDVMMPMLDGFEVLHLIRRRSNVPVLMLTARTTSTDQLTGLNMGADDYLPKPFGVDLLLARIRAVLRRSTRRTNDQDMLHLGKLCITRSKREVTVDGELVQLTGIEYEVLDYLSHSLGRIVSKRELTVALFQRQLTQLDRSLDTHIYNIRKKLGELGELICTVRGIGYQLRTTSEGEISK
jgi:two-component system response regulator CpxR